MTCSASTRRQRRQTSWLVMLIRLSVCACRQLQTGHGGWCQERCSGTAWRHLSSCMARAPPHQQSSTPWHGGSWLWITTGCPLHALAWLLLLLLPMRLLAIILRRIRQSARGISCRGPLALAKCMALYWPGGGAYGLKTPCACWGGAYRSMHKVLTACIAGISVACGPVRTIFVPHSSSIDFSYDHKHVAVQRVPCHSCTNAPICWQLLTAEVHSGSVQLRATQAARMIQQRSFTSSMARLWASNHHRC